MDAFTAARPTLLGVAYRMLGSFVDAEDVVQEAWVRWSAADGIDEPTAWLRTVVTRLCLDELRSARRRRESYVGPWLPEPVATAAGALGPLDRVELRESVSLAMLLVLERLSPAERAVFVLREAFALPFDDVAAAVGRTAVGCRQLHRRARLALAADLPVVADRQLVLDRFLDALGGGDVADVTAILLDDAVLVSDGGGVVSAARRPVVGGERVARFLLGLLRRAQDLDIEVVEVNAGPAVVARQHGTVRQVLVLDVVDDRVRQVLMVSNPSKLQALP